MHHDHHDQSSLGCAGRCAAEQTEKPTAERGGRGHESSYLARQDFRADLLPHRRDVQAQNRASGTGLPKIQGWTTRGLRSTVSKKSCLAAELARTENRTKPSMR